MNVVTGSNPSSHVLILAPLGKDAELAAKVLNEAGISTEIMKSLKDLCQRLTELAATIILTEESIGTSGMNDLYKVLSEQPEWSDLPIILITSEKKRFDHTKKIIDHFGDLGNISILERPFSVVTLVTLTKVAIRARAKQYRIRDLLRELNKELQSRDDFLSVASHELKTPLTSLKLQVQLKNRSGQKGDLTVYQPERVNTFLKSADRQIERLSRLVDDMLDISKIENGKLSLSEKPCDLGEILKNVYDSFSAQIEQLGVKVSTEIEEGIVGNWDKYRIEQAVINLLSNALKYGAGSPVKLRVYSKKGLGCLEVKDNGPGISPEDQIRIFERFERAGVQASIAGLGLGLYISKQIVEMHNGTLNVISQKGSGSTFEICLPTQMVGDFSS